ncbi:hypothetical protein AN958_09700 [Leucoagaricus sp. SymC.cos]|nr:hypothetical protein AN958_09700 [Leucoagaricus sp. SymC.cos]
MNIEKKEALWTEILTSNPSSFTSNKRLRIQVIKMAMVTVAFMDSLKGEPSAERKAMRCGRNSDFTKVSHPHGGPSFNSVELGTMGAISPPVHEIHVYLRSRISTGASLTTSIRPPLTNPLTLTFHSYLVVSATRSDPPAGNNEARDSDEGRESRPILFQLDSSVTYQGMSY